MAWFAVASILGAEPGRPIACRTDVFLQCDAGGWVDDAIRNNNERARGTHPALYPCWTRPTHELAKWLAPAIPVESTCTYGSRLLVNLVGGLGIGLLAAGLRSSGTRFSVLAAFGPLLWFGTGNTITALPDHFGMSVGLLAASLGFFVSAWSFRSKAVGLGILTILCFGVTITNAVFPAMLLGCAIATTYRIRWPWYAATGLAGVLGLLAVLLILRTQADIRDRVLQRVESCLSLKSIRDPALAGRHFVRGLQDSAVGPTPTIGEDNPDEHHPMLTYQDGPYSMWPYDAVQSCGVAAWWFVLGLGAIRALRDPRTRFPAILLMVWIVWNGLLHTTWGDEYFLYTPHYAWALMALALLGWRSIPTRWVVLAMVPILGGAIFTLFEFRRLLNAIPY